MQIKKWTIWHQAALFSAVLFYYEIVFRLSTTGGLFRLGSVFMLLLCIAYGGFCACILFFLPGERWKRVGTCLILFLTSLPFLIEYFVYRQFKLLYDLNTVIAGAGDAVGSYSHEIYAMIFSPGGMLRIILFLLPTAAYGLLSSRIPAMELIIRRRSHAAVPVLSAAVLLGSIWGIISNDVFNSVWKTQYHFQTATGHFGLLTGIGLELRELWFGSSAGLNLETVTEPTVPVQTEQTQPVTGETVPVIEYGLNQLDIDFASLDADEQTAQLNAYVASLTPSSQNEYTGLFAGKNLIFITAEAFSPEVIDVDLTPTLYRLASKGIQFEDYYQMSGAGTTGGEYQNILAMVPTEGGNSFKSTASNYNAYTIGSMLDQLGYYGQAFHNNSYTYYSRHKTHINIGYSEGFMGYGNGMEEYVSDTWPQSDLEMFAGTIPLYIEKQPFNVYYMTVSGHSGYSAEGNAMTEKNWDSVKELPYSDDVKGYLAAQLELENALTHLVEQLEHYGIEDETVICLTADHFPYGLDNDAALGNLPFLSELYGYDVNTVFQRDHSSWILWCGALEEEKKIVVESPVCSLDILPTLANLFAVEFDSRLLVGRDVFADTEALVFNAGYDWLTEYGWYSASTGTFTQTQESVTLAPEYVESICAIVQNKVAYCEAVLENDYFRYLFGTS